MGGFILFPKCADETVEAVEIKFDRSLDVFRQKNLVLGARIVRRSFVAYGFCKITSNEDASIDFDNGDFAFVVGTFIYGDVTGRAALLQCYADFAAERLDEERIAGNFHLLMYKDGELWSFGDYCGYYPVYVHEATNVISSSYLAVSRAGKARQLNEQVFFEYVFHGFFVNQETLLRGVSILDSRHVWRLDPPLSSKERRPTYESISPGSSFSEIVEVIGGQLNRYFENLVKIFPHDIGSALSGGYDSRHMLALLRHAGTVPYLYVYGTQDAPDVRVARDIAYAEKLPLEHIDKSLSQKIDVDSFKEIIEHNVYFFDCIKPVGVIDDGSDLESRFARARHAKLQLNGAGGEIYREIWNIGDRSVSIMHFLKMRFDIGYYDFCCSGFNQGEYFSRFAEKIRGLLNIEGNTLTRRQAEMLFPFLRNKFAQSNNAANSQISHSLLPFMEPRFVLPSFDIPVRYKYCGELHGALIRAADSALAKYASAYGINFFEPVPLHYRLRRSLERQIPLTMRLGNRQRASRKRQPRPYFFDQPYLESIVGLKSLAISAYVDVSKINNSEMLSRALSVELLLSRH